MKYLILFLPFPFFLDLNTFQLINKGYSYGSIPIPFGFIPIIIYVILSNFRKEYYSLVTVNEKIFIIFISIPFYFQFVFHQNPLRVLQFMLPFMLILFFKLPRNTIQLDKIEKFYIFSVILSILLHIIPFLYNYYYIGNLKIQIAYLTYANYYLYQGYTSYPAVLAIQIIILFHFKRNFKMLILVSIFYYILLLSARKIIIIDILISFLIFLFMIIKERKLILLFFTSIFSILVIPIASYTKMPGRIIEYLKNIDEKGIFGDRNDRLHLFFDENPKYGNNLYELLFGSNIDSPGLHNYFLKL